MRRALGYALTTNIVVLSAVSCGGGALYDGTSERFFAPGTRLRPYVEDVEGARLVTAWWDRELQKPCWFDSPATDPDPDGVYWCLPRAGNHAADLGPFLDPACQVPLGSPPPDEDLPYVVARPLDACEHGLTFYVAGEVVTTRGYLHNGTSCIPDPDSRLKKLVRLGAAVDPPFARATEAVHSRGGRIDPIVRTGADGSSEIVGAFDRERGERVRANPTNDRRLRWLPLGAAFGHGTGHSSCAGIASKLKHNAICPISVVATVAPECGVTLQAIGRQLSNADLAIACAADTGADDTFFFETGPALPPESFARATTIDVGVGRVRTRAFAGPDGSRALLRKAFFDTVTNAECVPAPAIDESRRCLPSPTVVPAFTDAACTVPAALDATVDCERLERGAAVRIAEGERYGAYVLDGEHVDVFRRDAEGCVAAGMGYAVRPLAPATFAIAVETRE